MVKHQLSTYIIVRLAKSTEMMCDQEGMARELLEIWSHQKVKKWLDWGNEMDTYDN